MSKFKRFYNGVCYRVIPLVLLGLMFVVAEVTNILSGRALGTVDIIALVGGIIESCGVLIFWFVLTLIQRYKDNKYLQKGSDIS